MRETLGRESLRRMLSLVVTLAMVLGMCPAVGVADDGSALVVQGQDDNVLTTQAVAKGVNYLDANGEQQTAYGVIDLVGGESWGEEDETHWYVVHKDHEYNYSGAEVEGEVHLILEDTASINVTGGIVVTSGSSLTIYAQSTDAATMGSLQVTRAATDGEGAKGGIVAVQSLTINGGNVTASGADAGIVIASDAASKGALTINGGIVNATTIAGANGISALNGDVNINGGTVSASGKQSSISAINGNVTIGGGEITASGAEQVQGIIVDRIDSTEGGNLTISGGTVNASGMYFGMACHNLTIDGGTVTATSTEDNEYAGGIRGIESVTINGGTVTASGVQHSVLTNGTVTIGDNVSVLAGANEADAVDHTADFATTFSSYPWARTEKAAPAPIEPVSVESVTVDPTTATLNVGDSTTLTATVEPADVANKTVTWKSSDEGVAKVDENGLVTAVAAGTATITATSVVDSTKSATCAVTVTKKPDPKPDPKPDSDPKPAALQLTGSGHVQSIGDKAAQKLGDGILIGTTGEAKRLEAFTVSLPKGTDGGIEYRGHLQSKGWGDWSPGGNECGSRGAARRVEAVQMRLTGGLENTYSVWYRVHSQTFGWFGWAHDGQAAGTAGQSKRAEAIEVVLLPKAQTPADLVQGEASYVGAICADVHLQSTGWTGQKSVLKFGTTGEARRLEAMRITVPNQPLEGGITYQVHAQRIGWMPAILEGNMAGTTGESRRIEAVSISLTGKMATSDQYSVWYRVHAQTNGWMGWAHDGEPAGTTGLAKRAEAIEVQILPSGQVPKGYDGSRVPCING